MFKHALLTTPLNRLPEDFLKMIYWRVFPSALMGSWSSELQDTLFALLTGAIKEAFTSSSYNWSALFNLEHCQSSLRRRAPEKLWNIRDRLYIVMYHFSHITNPVCSTGLYRLNQVHIPGVLQAYMHLPIFTYPIFFFCQEQSLVDPFLDRNYVPTQADYDAIEQCLQRGILPCNASGLNNSNCAGPAPNDFGE